MSLKIKNLTKKFGEQVALSNININIEKNEIMPGLSFNEFAIAFYQEVKLVPLSRYLKTNNRAKRMPKIMTMKKAGELLLFTKTDDETLSFLKRKGYNEIPELDYKTMMLLRRLDPIDNWKKIRLILSSFIIL